MQRALDETNSRSIGKGYAFYMKIAYALLALLIIVNIVVAIIYWDIWSAFFKSSGNALWWVPILPVLAVAFWIFLFACLLKGADDKKTKMRNMAIHEECKKINREYLSKSDVKVSSGDYSAWLEIDYDPKKGELKFNEINFNSKIAGIIAPMGRQNRPNQMDSTVNQIPINPNSQQQHNRNIQNQPSFGSGSRGQVEMQNLSNTQQNTSSPNFTPTRNTSNLNHSNFGRV